MKSQEKTYWESHPFFWKFFYWIVLCYVVFLIVLVVSIWVTILFIVSLIAFAILAFPALLQFIRWKSIFYRITDERVFIRIGILNITERSILLDKIEHFQMIRTLIDRLFNTGDILFFTDGEKSEGTFYDVPKIRAVEGILTDLLGRRS
ncbi:MAG: PH domain-containing protein [Promethearchaeota archaeon]|nr:MAG: PH domain-containing protein [Candidatus Lokiarchaeota archaeon]